MELNLSLPSTVEFDIDHQLITIHAFDANEATQNLHKQAVNVIASGPSIANIIFSKI